MSLLQGLSSRPSSTTPRVCNVDEFLHYLHQQAPPPPPLPPSDPDPLIYSTVPEPLSNLQVWDTSDPRGIPFVAPLDINSIQVIGAHHSRNSLATPIEHQDDVGSFVRSWTPVEGRPMSHSRSMRCYRSRSLHPVPERTGNGRVATLNKCRRSSSTISPTHSYFPQWENIYENLR